MTKQRQQAYVKLVKALLHCQNGAESLILASQPELVDKGLVIELLNAARLKAEQNDRESTHTIQWSMDFANQLAQGLHLNLQSINSQMNFLMTVFQSIHDTNENPRAVYPLFRDNLPLINEELISILTIWVWTEDDRQQSILSGIIGFANMINRFPFGNRSTNLEIAIECYNLALDVYIDAVSHQGCAMIHRSLAGVYQSRIRGEKAANLEKSLAYYRLALYVLTITAFPEDWAMTQMNLGITYKNRIQGDKATNLEESIACSQLALGVYTRAANPKMWAMTQLNLANAYKSRIRGERAANLEESIACSQLALQVITREAFPEDWAMTQMNLANSYKHRIQGEKATNLEESIACYRLALEVYTDAAFPEMWAMTQMNLAGAYTNRIQGEKATNLEESIACYRLALDVITRNTNPAQWAMIQMNLSIAYRHRLQGEKAENVEIAISCSQLALEVYTRAAFPEMWAMTQNNLASDYYDRIHGDRAENLESAIDSYRLALEIFTPESFPIQCLSTAKNLGDLFFGQPSYEQTSEGSLLFHQGMWQLAIDAYDLAIQSVETSRSWATDDDSRQRIIREALSVYENTVQSYINLGQIELAITTSERARSRQLIDFMATEDIYPNSEIPPEIRELLAKYQEINSQIQTYQNPDTTDSQKRTNRTNVNRISETLAANTLEILTLTAKKDRIWQQIRQNDPVIAGQIQVDPIDFPTIQSLIPNSQTAILSFYSTEEDTHIFILAKGQKPRIHTLQGQGVQTFQQWLKQHWLIPYTFLKYLQPLQEQELLPDPLPNLGEDIKELTPEQQQTYLAACKEFAQENHIDEESLKINWRGKMITNLAEISDRLQLQSLVAKLPPNINELIIIPHIYLHQIPLAALPFTPHQEGAEGNLNPIGNNLGNYLSDRFTIRYAPSCQILKYCTDRTPIEQIQYGTVEDADGTLPGARFEGQQISEIHQIPDKYRLIGKSQASIENYQQLLKQVTNVHSSHHASSSLDNPLESHIKLANGVINLRDIFNNRYPNLNEVFLSCCETSLGSATVTDDLLTITTAFLCSGARSVISTLWSVDDLATWIFSVFYHQLRKDGVNRSTAIQKAQYQLRTLNKEQFDPLIADLIKTSNTLASEYGSIEISQEREINTPEDPNDIRTVIDSLRKRLRSLRRQDYPFENPYHWAGFTCQGLTDVNAPTDAIFLRGTTLQTSDKQQNVINSEEVQGLATELASIKLFNSINTAISYFETGQRLAKSHDFQGAISMFSRAIKLDANNNIYWRKRGHIYANLAQYQKAVEDYSKAIELNPNDDLTWHNRCCVHSILNLYQKAVEDIIRAVEISPNNDAYLNHFIMIVDEFEKSVELDSSNEQNLLIAVGLSTPIDLLAKLNSLVELDARHWNLQGMKNRSLNQFAEAIENFTKAINLNPDNDLYWYNRGGAYSSLQQHQKALEDCSKAIELNPRDPISWNGRGLTHYRLEQYHQAYINFYQASKLDFNNIEYRNNRKAANARLQSTG